jgi:16S rRNA (uracil1498-N3)-methyltransferase
MRIAALTEWPEYVRSVDLPSVRLLAHPRGGVVPSSICDVALAVGPEGGFTDEEVAQALEANWRTVDLGPRLLRVETAALALAAMRLVLAAPTPPA